MQCFVSVPEGVGNSTPPCWWDDCRYQIRGRPARPVVPFYSTSCVCVCVSHLRRSPTGLSGFPGRWTRRRFDVSSERPWKSGVMLPRSPSQRSAVGGPTSASTSQGGRTETCKKTKKTSLNHEYKRRRILNTSRYYWKGVYLLCSNRTEKSF